MLTRRQGSCRSCRPRYRCLRTTEAMRAWLVVADGHWSQLSPQQPIGGVQAGPLGQRGVYLHLVGSGCQRWDSCLRFKSQGADRPHRASTTSHSQCHSVTMSQCHTQRPQTQGGPHWLAILFKARPRYVPQSSPNMARITSDIHAHGKQTSRTSTHKRDTKPETGRTRENTVHLNNEGLPHTNCVVVSVKLVGVDH